MATSEGAGQKIITGNSRRDRECSKLDGVGVGLCEVPSQAHLLRGGCRVPGRGQKKAHTLAQAWLLYGAGNVLV